MTKTRMIRRQFNSRLLFTLFCIFSIAGAVSSHAFQDNAAGEFPTIPWLESVFSLQDLSQHIDEQSNVLRVEHPNGIPVAIAQLNDEQVLHGTVLAWYPDSSKCLQGEMANGKQIGEWRRWYPNGQIMFSVQFDKGEKHGEVRVFYPSGALKQLEYYRHGKKHGEFVYFLEDGNPAQVENFKNDVQHGMSIYYYGDGSTEMEVHWVSGAMEGQATTYYSNGTVQSVEWYWRGQANGPTTFFRPDGSIQREVDFMRGVIEEIRDFDENGELIRISTPTDLNNNETPNP